MRYTTRPISDRTRFTGEHKNSPFTVTWSTAQDLLDRELDYLDAKDIALEVDVDDRAIRIDGTMRADAKVHSPAVRLAFETNGVPLIYATDKFVRPSYRREGMQRDWQHNLYAIAKGLEALRLVDRYEIAGTGEQYVGFKALPAGRAMPASHMTETAAAELIRAYGRAGDDLTAAWRQARRRTHTDSGGRRADWDRVEEAARVLGLTS